MQNDSWIDRARLRGYMFEVVVLKLLEMNGFIKVTKTCDKIREDRSNFYEVRGRGAWHQIDCLCDYSVLIPFIYPIRIIGEVKFYSKPLTKEKIREFIGVIKDIQENYFAVDDCDLPSERVSELGVYFSANGFDEQAERLAFVHNIKTVSYRNNYIVDRIKNYIRILESNYLSSRVCLAVGRLNVFIQRFTEYLNSPDDQNLRTAFLEFALPSDGINNVVNQLHTEVGRIRSSFVAFTTAGYFIHFLGYNEFPSEIFRDTDTQSCRVFYSDVDAIGERKYWLTFSRDQQGRRYYFTPPETLKEAAFYGGATVLGEKGRIFKKLQVQTEIDNIKRSLTIELDQEWLRNATRVLNNVE